MSTYNRLNVTLIKKDLIPSDTITMLFQRLKETYNTEKIFIISDFGTEDKFVVFDEETLNIIISC